jgi:hypothetical protein
MVLDTEIAAEKQLEQKTRQLLELVFWELLVSVVPGEKWKRETEGPIQ